MEIKRKNGVAPPQYDEAFKAGSIRLETEQGRPSTEIAKEFGICIDTLRNWLKSAEVRPGPGQIFHSDRRVQYAAAIALRDRLAALGIRQSRKGNPYDNAEAENFFDCLKCELVHLRRYNSRRAAEADLFAYMDVFYNAMRPHSALGWLSPCIFEQRPLSSAA